MLESILIIKISYIFLTMWHVLFQQLYTDSIIPQNHMNKVQRIIYIVQHHTLSKW